MDLRHLHAVEAVLSTGSFTAAAAARHISQPALWAQVKELESELGLRLFVRSGRGVVPTAACLALRPALERVLRQVEQFRGLATRVREGEDAPARLGCASSHVAHFLAPCIRDMLDAHPSTPLPVVVPITTDTATQHLVDGQIDLLVEPRSRRPAGHAAMLYQVGLVATGPGIATGGRLDISALSGRPLATLPTDSLARRMLEGAAAAAGVSLRVVHESRDTTALLAMADQGLCTAVLTDEHTGRGRDAVRIRSGRRPLSVPLWLRWRPDAELSPAARLLRDVMLQRAGAQPA